MTVDGIPWHPGSMKYDDALVYARLLHTACYIVIAYLSGMRPGEVLTLTAGCLHHDPERDLWTLTGTRWKGATGSHGGKAEEGATRENPWVVHPLVAQAVTVAEELGNGRLLFPKSIRPKENRPKTRRYGCGRARPGQPRKSLTTSSLSPSGSTTSAARTAVRTPSRRTPTGGSPPAASAGPSPGTLCAAPAASSPRQSNTATSTSTSPSYAGNYASGFPDDLAFEQWLERIDQATDLEAYLDGGGHISGPAASELERRIRVAREKFAGRVLLTGRQARKLLQDPVLQVYPGRGLHCVFDRAKARCIREADDGPVLAECNPGAPTSPERARTSRNSAPGSRACRTTRWPRRSVTNARPQ
ncbi:hypothetical protein AHiyo1_44190 [Arthrobacter sp. Hiyo1]|uniref:hypothetical protein n=1 Tax=Arthrobacter sp. Hiyo1 TaxID=1588020 RepID=UPI0006A36A8C|nr:hypothetical protein [Arthrobacter sp. Hiyo1]GAP60823.1 hypothetical protein AHiyo1_44190 [Arthrobacter sp. Hiyo1]